MGYPQFNLTTLQLPAPASNMTKAEYKEAYGIDLDDTNIKAFKLVLFGNDKFPIDQIKEIEDGYEIYFNGRILSITDIVQTSDEVYNVANSKPIYCHPLYIANSAIGFKIGVMILDNSPTQYTLTSFKAFLDNLYTSIGSRVRIIASGACEHAGTNGTYDGDFFTLATLEKYSDNIYMLNGFGVNGSRQATGSWNDLFAPGVTEVVDGVNKIN